MSENYRALCAGTVLLCRKNTHTCHREWDVMWVSHLCGSGRYVGFVPARSIFPQFAASATHVLVSILTLKSIHISGFTFAFIGFYRRRQQV